MENKIRRITKKAIAVLVAAALFLTGISYLPENSGKAYAEESAEVSVDESWLHTEQLDMSEYVTLTEDGKNVRTAPKPKDVGYEEWIFAGWYSDASCEKQYAMKSADTGETVCYAKFVPAGLLSVKCQTVAGTTAEDKSSQLRLVSTVDNLQYSKVGFDIWLGDKELPYETKKVYKKITVTEDSASQVAFDYTPEDFHEMAQWFTTVTIVNINKSDFATGVLIKPYWVTLDGTKVYGVSRYARVEDSYKHIVNVPIRLYSDAKVSSGSLDVAYNSDLYEYYPNISDGSEVVSYDLDKDFFGEMEVTDSSVTDENGRKTLTCKGTTTANEVVTADGLFVNLRFKVKDGRQPANEADRTFHILNPSFQEGESTVADAGAVEYVYRDIFKSNLDDMTLFLGNGEVLPTEIRSNYASCELSVKKNGAAMKAEEYTFNSSNGELAFAPCTEDGDYALEYTLKNQKGNTVRKLNRNAKVYMHVASAMDTMENVGIAGGNSLENLPYTREIVDLSADGEIGRPEDAVNVGNSALKMTLPSGVWGNAVAIYIGNAMKNLENYDDTDCLQIWMYHTGNQYEDNNYLLGNINENHVFDEEQAGQSWEKLTPFVENQDSGKWFALRFTVKELRNQLKKQEAAGGSAPEWIRLYLTYDEGTSFYIYSVEFYEEQVKVATVIAADDLKNVGTVKGQDADKLSYTRDTITFEEANINKPDGAVDAGDQVLKMTLYENQWENYVAISGGEVLKNLNQYKDTDYFRIWMYYEGNSNSDNVWNRSYLLGNADEKNEFIENGNGQSTEGMTGLGLIYRGKWNALTFTVKEWKEQWASQGKESGTAPGWIKFYLNYAQNSSVYLYTIEFHSQAEEVTVASRTDAEGTNVARMEWYTEKPEAVHGIVDLTTEGEIGKPEDAVDAGNNAYKTTLKNNDWWGEYVAISGGEALRNLDQYKDTDYFLVWMYRTGEQWNNNSYLLGNLEANGKFSDDHWCAPVGTGESYPETKFTKICDSGAWHAQRFTVKELKEQWVNQGGPDGVVPGWIRLNLNYHNNSSFYIYSVELHRVK